MYRSFARAYGWTPDVVAQMTPAQQLMYLEDASADARTGRSTKKFATLSEAERYVP